ncbi:transglutaminase domain-containing protein [Xylanibacillus composti]|uniref:Transglutaminase domain-containing protein n=1 Tax=Xylanibacillus composti TaxID=1572762 RepID=A0A8J4H203_9BACL|nr:transglutaminase-like domain-containing protein [Xylanibacillus composti]MDT9726828.1 transglutaminase domain-containing protein [Xylanibacillus composti]GIQ67188.1 transglutaminase domain-containing protein [Xylanibacillus composti]
MKTWKWVLYGVLICALLAPTSVLAAEPAPVILFEEDAGGVVQVNLPPTADLAKIKIRISKGEQQYTYDAGSYNIFPLQMGDGNYSIMLLEQVTGNKYRLLKGQQVTYKAQTPEEVYQQSIQNIQWDESMDVIEKAAALTEKLETDEEKIKAIYQYVVSNITYDYEKAKSVKSGYIPSVEQTYESKSGICYDYAAIFAAMLRSVDIPTKLVMGHRSDISEYHAWNEVYLKEKDEWRTIDTTYDAAFIGKQVQSSMYQNSDLYTSERAY